jgi:hypothetical protein
MEDCGLDAVDRLRREVYLENAGVQKSFFDQEMPGYKAQRSLTRTPSSSSRLFTVAFLTIGWHATM